jgi:hypothetical protein
LPRRDLRHGSGAEAADRRRHRRALAQSGEHGSEWRADRTGVFIGHRDRRGRHSARPSHRRDTP